MLYEPKEFSSWRYSVNTGGQLKNFWYISTEFGGSQVAIAEESI